MSNLKYSQFLKLRAMDREPIDLPSNIYFAGNVTMQKSHCTNDMCKPGACKCGGGMHHLPEFQKTGTYWHPNLAAWRLRVAKDRLDRAQKNQASETELRKSGGSMEQMNETIKQYTKELEDVLSGKNPEANLLFEKEMEAGPQTSEEADKTVEEVETKPVVIPRRRGRPAVAAEPVNKSEMSVVAKTIAANQSAGLGLESDGE